MLRTLTRKFSVSVVIFVALIALLAVIATRVAWQNIALGKRMTGQTMTLVTATDRFNIEMSRAIAKTRVFGHSFRPADRADAVQALDAAESWLRKLNELAPAADAAPSAELATRLELLQRQQAVFDRGAQTIRAALPVVISNSPQERAGAFERLQQFESEWEALMVAADAVVEHEIASASTALTERNQGNLVLMPVSFAFVGLAAVLSLLALRRWIIRPIGALSAATTAFGTGKHELSVEVTNDDEIGDLQRAFNQMAANVRDSQAAIKQRSAQLESSLQAQQQLLDTVKQLSTPLLPVMDGIVILPIVGHVDTQRADHLMHTLLHGVAARRARVAILDLTGIAMLDTHVLGLLMQAVRATELLGARVLLAGFSAATAQVIVEQGVPLGNLHSYRDLASALEAAATDVQRNNLRYGFGEPINQACRALPRRMPATMMLMRPLAGITVLDCTRVLAGPYCTMLLGDLGADVIKVEQPGRGDETRAWGPPFVGGESPYFWAANRNKRSITLDLSSPAGRAIFLRLAERSQLFVDNFKPGTLERWGCDDATLWQRNPALVHTAISAYGTDGPKASSPGYDFLLQAESGWMSVTGDPDGEPTKLGMALVDVLTGTYAATASLAALRAAEQSGRGQRVDCSLLRSAVAALINVGSGYLATGQEPRRWGNAHATIVPYQLFHAGDEPFVLAVGNDGQWRRCCEALDRPQWAGDPRFNTNPARVAHRDELIPLLQNLFATHTATHWIQVLVDAQVPCGPVNTVGEVFADAQVRHAGLRQTIPHPAVGEIALLAPPFELSASPAEIRLPPPLLGQHTDEVLREAGFTTAEVAQWRNAGII